MARHTDIIKELKNYEYPFENIVFEGGGAKGHAYIGVLEVFDELGVYNQFKRFAGVSIGAIVATMMAIGLTPKEIRANAERMGSKSFLDAGCGLCSFIPNLLGHYGWHSGNTFYKLLEEELRKRFGAEKLTFEKLYHDYQKELCVVVANLSTGNVEYFHPKTTPKFSVAEAVSMSCSIPVIMQPRKSRLNGRDELFVDGGILNNFPMNCFDGWYLSMDPENSFLHRELDSKCYTEFDPLYNGIERKSIGVLVYSTDEQEMFKHQFQTRNKEYPPIRPNTKLSRKRGSQMTKIHSDLESQNKVKDAAFNLLRCLRKTKLDSSTKITKDEMVSAMTESNFTSDHYKILFGETTPDKVFDQIDEYSDGYISVHALASFFSTSGFPIQHGLCSNASQRVCSLRSYVVSIVDAVTSKQKEVVTKGTDFKRVIGINCDYIATADDVTDEDTDFLIMQGRNATISFLIDFVQKQNGDRTPA